MTFREIKGRLQEREYEIKISLDESTYPEALKAVTPGWNLPTELAWDVVKHLLPEDMREVYFWITDGVHKHGRSKSVATSTAKIAEEGEKSRVIMLRV